METLEQLAEMGSPGAGRAVGRHMPILRRCIGQRETPVLLARCGRPEQATPRGRHQVLMLTKRRLVVTAESRLFRRLRLHLNCELRHLADVTWTPEPALGGIRLAATAVDGVREHFWVDAGDAARVHRMAGMFGQLFAA